MSLVPSLLQAIVHLDGEALVMHAGDKPYVVSPSGQVDLATRGLALDAINGIVNHLLPIESQHALDEFGAVQYELPARSEFPGELFTVVAARGGDDIWVEVRRRRVPDEDRIPEEFFPPPDEAAKAQPYPVYASAASREFTHQAEPLPDSLELDAPGAAQMVADATLDAPEHVVEAAKREKQTPSEPATQVPIAVARKPLESFEPPAPVLEPIAVKTPLVEIAAPVPVADAEAFVVEEVPASIEEEAASTVEASSSVVEETLPQITVGPTQSPAMEPAIEPTIGPEPPAAQQPVPAVLREVAAVASEPIAVVEESSVPTAPAMESAQVSEEPPSAIEDEPIWVFEEEISVVIDAPEFVEPAEIPEPPAALSQAMSAQEPVVKTAAPEPVAQPPAPEVVAQTAVPEPVAKTQAPEPVTAPPPAVSEPAVSVPPPVVQAPTEAVTPLAVEPPHAGEPAVAQSAPQPAVVLPLSRNPIRSEHPLPPIGDPTMSGLDRLLRLSAARGASTLYLSSQSRPSVRVDSELQTLEGEPILTSRDVESLLLTLMPERSHEALRTGAATEWIADIEDVGRVRCMSFRDHLGPGGVFRLMPTRSVSADQLGLPRVVQALAVEPEGLVLVAGPRSSGKRTLMAAFLDLINRTRRDHVISIEREINIAHERGTSFISQREVRGSDDEMLAAARAALREDPDVLIIEDLRTAALMSVALDASQSGHLVIGGFSAHTATAAVDRIIDLYGPEQRRQVQLALADSLRGVVSQVLLKKKGGGRVAAREVLLNTPAVSSVIAEGKTSQLPMAIEGGRRYGMMPLNDALVGLVQQGVVDGREAYRYATDRAGLLALLARQGLDTSFVEKLA